MGDQRIPKNSPATTQGNPDALQMKTAQAPGFNLSATPIQKKDKKEKEAPKVTKTPEEIEAKKKELEADLTVISPGEKWERTDKAITDAAAKRAGVKRVAKLYSPTICGKKVANVNELCKAKVDKVNEAFNKETEPIKKEITDSLQVVGGYNYRVQSSASSMDKELAEYGLTGYKRVSLSDHALGCAFDVNANMATKQNHHWKKINKKDRAEPLLAFMETIIKKYDATFDLATTTGAAHVTGLNAFSAHLQTYVNTLIGNAEKVNIFEDEANVKKKLTEVKTDKANAKIIIDNWNTFKGYEYGTRHTTVKGKDKDEVITDGSFDRTKTDSMDLKGVIDIHPKFVQFMIDAGFTWGGDFGPGNKDYMHFEDNDAEKLMKTEEKTTDKSDSMK